MDRDDLTRTLFKGGAVLFFGLVIDLGISFGAKLLIARHLGRVDYGAVSIGSSFLTFTSMALLLGLDNGVGRYLPRYDAQEEQGERRGTILVGFVITIPLSIVVAAVTILGREWVATSLLRAPEADSVIAVFAIGLPFAVMFRYTLGIIKGYQWSVPKALLQNILKPLVRFGGIAIGVVIGLDATGMSIAYILPFVAVAGASLYWLRRTALFGFNQRTATAVDYASLTRSLLSFSLPLIITTVMMKILTDIDRFLLSFYQSTGAVGIYSVIYPLSQLLIVGLSALSFLFMPILSELHADGNLEEMRRMYRVATKWIFFTTVPIGAILVLFPGLIIRYSFGAEYVPGATALVVLTLGFFTHTIVGLNGTALTSIGRTKTLAVVNAVTAGANIGLNLVLIPRYSYLGAAVATAVSYAGMNAIYTIVLYRDTGIQPFSRALVRPGVVLVGYVAVLYLSLTRIFAVTWVWFGVHLVAAGVGYVIIPLHFGAVQEEEVIIIKSIEERFDVNLESVKRRARTLM